MSATAARDSPPDPPPVVLAHLSLARPLAVIDLEATGLDPNTDRVVEIAVLRVDSARQTSGFTCRVNPELAISPAATAVHGIGDTDVRDAPPFRDVAPYLLAFLDGCDLAGFGLAHFDLPLLAAECARSGQALILDGRAVVDALAVFWRMEPRDLVSAVRLYLGRDHSGAHSAAADARAALEVLDAQVGRYGLPASPAGLHAAYVEVDVGGRFRRDAGGRIVFGFGKHRGRPLADVARLERGYLLWLLANVPLLTDARALVENALTVMPNPFDLVAPT